MIEIEKLDQVQTLDGKGRSWIRYLLNNNLALPAFENLLNSKLKSEYSLFIVFSPSSSLYLSSPPFSLLPPSHYVTLDGMLPSPWSLVTRKIQCF